MNPKLTDMIKLLKKYREKSTGEILYDENCFSREEVVCILQNGLHNAKDLKTKAIPWEAPEKPTEGMRIEFMYKEGEAWRRACFEGTSNEDFPYELRLGELYTPPMKKFVSRFNSVYGKISAKFKNIFPYLS